MKWNHTFSTVEDPNNKATETDIQHSFFAKKSSLISIISIVFQHAKRMMIFFFLISFIVLKHRWCRWRGAEYAISNYTTLVQGFFRAEGNWEKAHAGRALGSSPFCQKVGHKLPLAKATSISIPTVFPLKYQKD